RASADRPPAPAATASAAASASSQARAYATRSGSGRGGVALRRAMTARSCFCVDTYCAKSRRLRVTSLIGGSARPGAASRLAASRARRSAWDLWDPWDMYRRPRPSLFRCIFDQDAAAVLEAGAEFLFEMRPAVGVFLRIALEHDRVLVGFVDDCAGG